MTDRRGKNSGASLVFALFAVATLVSLALAASALARGRMARANSRVARAALRDSAEKALVEALHAISADTNAVDALSEPWARESAAAAEAEAAGGDGVFVVVADERARLGVPECGEKGLAALLSLSSGLDSAAASGLAHALFASGAAAAGGEGAAAQRKPPAEEFLACDPAVASEDDRAALLAALPFLSVSAGPAFNVNTAPRETVVAAALAGGATPGGAEGLWLRLEMARGRGDVFETTSPAEAMKLLRGEGDVPTAEEIEALAAIQSRLCVSSGLFRVRASARRGGRSASVGCVYERATGRVFRWTHE